MIAERKYPLYGCLLIGGKSSRMGSPKHLLKAEDGLTWFHHTVAMLHPFVQKIIVAGAGSIPSVPFEITRVDDSEGVHGPLAGILSSMETWREADWLVLACDMPMASKEAISWILECASNQNVSGVVPYNTIRGQVEPLMAFYSAEALTLFQQIKDRGRHAVSQVAEMNGIVSPAIPHSLTRQWQNINTPEEMKVLDDIQIVSVEEGHSK